MAGRHRFEVMSAEADTFSQVGLTGYGGTCTVSVGDCVVPSGIGTTSGNFQKEYEYREMDDVVTDNFHKRKAQGVIINSPLNSTYEKVSHSKVHTYLRCMNQKYGCTPAHWYDLSEHMISGTLSPEALCGADMWIPPEDLDLVSLKDQAISKAWANIDVSEVLAIASLKESGQTLAGLVYIYKKVYRILKAVARLEVNHALQRKRSSGLRKEFSLSELKEVYLNARYNLRPLAYDVSGMMKVLKAPLTKAMRQTYRGNLSKKGFTSDTINKYVFYHSAFDLEATIHRSSQIKVDVRAGVLTDVEPLTVSDLLGGDEIVAAAWDLLPFSFIVDWFMNAGDTIIAWSPNLRAKTLASWVVTKTTTTQTSTVLGATPHMRDSYYRWLNPSYSVSPTTSTRVLKTVVREPEYSRPIIPSFRWNLDPLKLLDLGLILGNLKGFKFASQ
jgi:hypothetical protein